MLLAIRDTQFIDKLAGLDKIPTFSVTMARIRKILRAKVTP